MIINKDELHILWYENEDGDKYVLKDGEYEAPDGFIYQHSKFPSVLRHNILRLTQEKEVTACKHPSKYVVPTYGWVYGIEGRKCKACNGTQVKEKYFKNKICRFLKIRKPWGRKWSSDGAVPFFFMDNGWSEDIVLALAKSGDYTLSEAIIISSDACERCINSLANKYGLDWGYKEYSEDWEDARTQCSFCKEDECCQ